VDLIGHMKLKLWVSAEGTDDLDLHVAIKKFDRYGNEIYFPDFQHVENGLAASGWLRVSHRELDPARSTPWQPWLKHERLLKLSEGEIVPCEVEILASATGFKAGDRLRLVVQGYDSRQATVCGSSCRDTISSTCSTASNTKIQSMPALT
jgi:predicted acyl esterase